MRSRHQIVLAAAVMMAVCHSGASHAAGAASGAMTEIQNFRLTNDFLQRYMAYNDEAAQKPCELSPMALLGEDDDQDRSLAQTAAAFDAHPGVHAALQRHGLTARELILGMTTLMAAATQEMARQHPGMVEKGEMAGRISPANMAFYNAHKDALRRHNQQMAREQLKKNGGRLPACLSE